MSRSVLFGVVAGGVLLSACGSSLGDDPAEQTKSTPKVMSKAPTVVLARVPLDNPDVSKMEFVAVDSARIADGQEAAARFLAGAPFGFDSAPTAEVEHTQGVVGTPAMPSVYQPYYNNYPYQVGAGMVPNAYNCGTQGGWQMPIYGQANCGTGYYGGFFRSIFWNTVNRVQALWYSHPIMNGIANMTQWLFYRVPVYSSGGYQYGYGFQNYYDHDGYRYYQYNGQNCGVNGYPGQWTPNGCVMPQQFPYGGYCGQTQVWYNGQCYGQVQPMPSGQCGTGMIPYMGNCIAQPIAPNPCWQGQVMYNNTCYAASMPVNNACGSGMIPYQGQCLYTAQPVAPMPATQPMPGNDYQYGYGYGTFNGPTYPQTGMNNQICPAGQMMQNGVCVVAVNSQSATPYGPSSCPSGMFMSPLGMCQQLY